jgi:hypothetical protein
MLTIAAAAGHAASPVRTPQVGAEVWGASVSYRLTPTTRVPGMNSLARNRSLEVSAVQATARRHDGGAQNRLGADRPPRIGNLSGDYDTLRRLDRRRLNVETVPVTILGRRFMLSRFTVDRRGVRGMVSTEF